jgi:hypothetical protein
VRNSTVSCLCPSGYAGYQCQLNLLGGDGTQTAAPDGGLSPGAIVGIVVGCVVAGILIALLIVLYFRYRRQKQTEAAKIQIAARNNLSPRSSQPSPSQPTAPSSVEKDYTNSMIPLQDLSVENYNAN